MSEKAEVTDPFRVKLLSIITDINGINELKNSTFNHFKEIEYIYIWSIERQLAASKSSSILFTRHKVRGPTQSQMKTDLTA